MSSPCGSLLRCETSTLWAQCVRGWQLLPDVLLHCRRTDLQIGVIATLISLAIGTVIGALAAYYGGWVDVAFMRALDVTVAFPSMVLVIAIVALLGPGAINIYVALTD